VSDDGPVIGDQRCDQRGAHAVQRGVLLCPLEDQTIGGGNRLTQSFLEILLVIPGRTHPLDERIDGKPAGNLAGSGSAHSIADDEYTGIEADSERVFVGNPHTPGVTTSSGLKLGWYLHSSQDGSSTCSKIH
jgi:hypothetical protein